MRAVWLVRDNLTRHPGGDTVQILRTAEAVRKLGCEVVFESGPRVPLQGYDVAHLFHLDRLWENEHHCRRLRRHGLPAVLSTIYWPSDRFDLGGRTGLQGWLARSLGSDSYRSLRPMQRWVMHFLDHPHPRDWYSPPCRFKRSVRFILETVSVILPNSVAECEQVERLFGGRLRSLVVPNAADTGLFQRPADSSFVNRRGVLCVGRIEPRKNQLALIRALRGTGIELTLVGQSGRYSGAYGRRCEGEAEAAVRFLGHRGPEELRELYVSARVHANVSWYETPGLANLEAALSGCAIVATPGGCTREYLGDEVHYCEPDDVHSIAQAVEEALVKPPASTLRDRIVRQYTWDVAGARTLEAYQMAIRRS